MRLPGGIHRLLRRLLRADDLAPPSASRGHATLAGRSPTRCRVTWRAMLTHLPRHRMNDPLWRKHRIRPTPAFSRLPPVHITGLEGRQRGRTRQFVFEFRQGGMPIRGPPGGDGRRSSLSIEKHAPARENSTVFGAKFTCIGIFGARMARQARQLGPAPGSPSWPRSSRPSTKSRPKKRKRVWRRLTQPIENISFPSLSRLALRGFAWMAATSAAMTVERLWTRTEDSCPLDHY